MYSKILIMSSKEMVAARRSCKRKITCLNNILQIELHFLNRYIACYTSHNCLRSICPTDILFLDRLYDIYRGFFISRFNKER